MTRPYDLLKILIWATFIFGNNWYASNLFTVLDRWELVWFLTSHSMKNLLKWINWCIKILWNMPLSLEQKNSIWAEWEYKIALQIDPQMTGFEVLRKPSIFDSCLTWRALQLNFPVSLSLTAPGSHHPGPDYWNPGLSSWVLPPAYRLLRLQGLPRLFLRWHPWLWWLSVWDDVTEIWTSSSCRWCPPRHNDWQALFKKKLYIYNSHRPRRWFEFMN